MPDTKVQIEYTQDELLKEALWETEMIRRGRDSYIASLEGQNLADTDVGMSLAMQMIPAIKSAIEEKQEHYVEVLMGSNSRAKTGAAHLLPLVKSDLLAVAIVQRFMREMLVTTEESDLKVRRVLDCLEEAYIEAMGLQIWEQEEEEEYAHFWKTQGDKLSTVGNNARTKNQFKVRLKQRLTKYYDDFKDQHDTTQHMQLSLATELLSCIGFTKVKQISEVNASKILEAEGPDSVMIIDGYFHEIEDQVGTFPDMFIHRVGTDRGKEVRTMHLSESTADTIDYTIERRALGNTSLRPMLVKPKRWILTTP